MDKRSLKIIFKIFISCLFIGYLAYKVDISLLLRTMRSVDVLLYALSTLLAVFSSTVVAAKYYCLIKGSSINHSMASLVKINFVTRFYALFLPSAIGREVVRWIKVTRNQNGKALFLALIVYERLTFLFMLLFCGLMPLFFYQSNAEIINLRMRILPAATLGLIIISIFISFFIFQPVRDFAISLIHRTLKRVRAKLDMGAYFENDRPVNVQPHKIIFLLGLSIVWQIVFICRLLVLIKAVPLPLDFIDIAWIGSLVLLLQTMPISFAGIGLRESAYAYLLSFFNLPPEKGVLIGILFFSQMLIIACVGGVLEFFER